MFVTLVAQYIMAKLVNCDVQAQLIAATYCKGLSTVSLLQCQCQ